MPTFTIFMLTKKQNTSTGVAPDTISKRGSVKKFIQKSNRVSVEY